MSLKKTAANWIKKFIYGLFILWVCGLTPLIFFEGFSSHFGKHQVYDINILGYSKRSQKLAKVSQLFQAGPKSQISSPVNHSIGPAQIGAVQLFLSTLNQSFLPVAAGALQNVLLLWGWIIALVLVGNSVWLPLPKKPPTFS